MERTIRRIAPLLLALRRFDFVPIIVAAWICLLALPGVAQTPQRSLPTTEDARRELQRAGVIRGRPGNDVAKNAAITKDELVQLMEAVVQRLPSPTPTSTPAPTATPGPTATLKPSLPLWFARRIPNAQGAAITGLTGWSDPRSSVSRQDALVFQLRLALSRLPIHEGNPRANVPKLADDAEIDPRFKPIIYQGLMQNLVRVDRNNKLHPNDPQIRDEAFLTGYQVLRSAGAHR